MTSTTRLSCDADSAGRARRRPADWSSDDITGPDWPRLPDPREDNGSSPFRVLVPFNGTDAARTALDVAADLALRRQALAWILYVRHWDIARGGNRFCLETTEQARQRAHSAVAELRRRGVPASLVIRDAAREKVGHAIVGEAERLDVGCIVMGTHAHGTFISALTGNVPREVARTTTRPIVVVRAPRTRTAIALAQCLPTGLRPQALGQSSVATPIDLGGARLRPGSTRKSQG